MVLQVVHASQSGCTHERYGVVERILGLMRGGCGPPAAVAHGVNMRSRHTAHRIVRNR